MATKKDFDGLGDLLNGLGDSKVAEVLPELSVESSSAVDINLIDANPHQPRFEEDVEELKASIQGAYKDLLSSNNYDEEKIKPEDGLLQPILLSKTENDTFICVGGHRRLKACRELGHKTIKANVVQLDPAQLVTFSIVENLQRVDLTPLETALAVDKAIASRAFESESKLAEALGKTPAWLSKCKSILKLPTVILDDLHKDRSEIGLEILVDLQRLQSDITKEELYFAYKKGEVKGTDIREAIKEEKQGGYIPKPIFTQSGSTLKLEFDCSEFVDGDILDIKDELIAFAKKLKDERAGFSQSVSYSFIKCMDLSKDSIYIEYQDGNSHSVSYTTAKTIFKNIYSSSIIDELPSGSELPRVYYTNGTDSSAGSDFINTLPNWKQNGTDSLSWIEFTK